MAKEKSDLPFGSEFSPSQIDLRYVLRLAKAHGTDVKAFECAVMTQYFAANPTSAYNRNKLANNTRLGMIAYGLITREGPLTPVGEALLSCDKDEDMWPTLGRHILLKLNGLEFVKCLREMHHTGQKIDLTTLRASLAVRGINFPRGGRHPSTLRLWLEKAGVCGSNWTVNEARLSALLGLDVKTLDKLDGLNTLQQAFLRALMDTGEVKPQPANKVAALAEKVYGVSFPEKSLPKLVLDALTASGFIVATKTTAGRGAKPFMVQPTDKLLKEVVVPALDQLKIDAGLRKLLSEPLDKILKDMASEDTYIKGLALEALAFKLMTVFGLEYVETRLRGVNTGGAEVDLLFQTRQWVYQRWQVQCKNTNRVTTEDVAKEVGVAGVTGSTVVVFITTGVIGAEARKFAAKTMASSGIVILLLDGNDVATLAKIPTHAIELMAREYQLAKRAKERLK